MSNKWIEYGPECEIDPEETIGSCGPHDMIQTLAKKLEKAYEALQQREERRIRCLNALVTMTDRVPEHIAEELYELIDILEGTDG